jgi:hypothetical protein
MVIIDHPSSSIQHPASSIQHPVSSIQNPMRRRRSWLKLVLALVLVLGALIYFFGGRTQQAICVTSLQNAVSRDAASFGNGWHPKLPPRWLNDRVTQAIDWYFTDARGYKRTDREQQLERFQSLFWSPIETIDIKAPGPFQGDAGVALAWFPHLLRIKVIDSNHSMSELDWTRICHGLGRSDSVQEILLSGETLTDAAVAHLASQPTLQLVTVSQNVLTAECAATFASLPKLKTLVIGAPKRHTGKNGFTFKEKDEIAAKLPSVELIFPQAYYAP